VETEDIYVCFFLNLVQNVSQFGGTVSYSKTMYEFRFLQYCHVDLIKFHTIVMQNIEGICKNCMNSYF